MNIQTYLKDQWVYVGTQAFFLVILIAILDLLKIPGPSIAFLAIVYVAFFLASVAMDYYKRAILLENLLGEHGEVDAPIAPDVASFGFYILILIALGVPIVAQVNRTLI